MSITEGDLETDRSMSNEKEGNQRSRKASIMSNNQAPQAAYPAPPYHSKTTTISLPQRPSPPIDLAFLHLRITNHNQQKQCPPHAPSSSFPSPQPSISSSSPSSSGPSPPTKAQKSGFGGLLPWRLPSSPRALFASHLRTRV